MRHRLVDQAVIVWVDNEATRAVLVSGSSPQRDVARLLEASTGLEIDAGAACWFERVPSASNIADAPSRGEPPAAPPGYRATRAAADFAAGTLGYWGVRERLPKTVTATEIPKENIY